MKYRKIDPRIWNDEKFRNLSDKGKLVFLFVLTHPHMTSLGGMRTTLNGLAQELGWSYDSFLKAFREVLPKDFPKALPKAFLEDLPKDFGEAFREGSSEELKDPLNEVSSRPEKQFKNSSKNSEKNDLWSGMIEYDERACCLVVTNFLKYNKPESPNVVKSWNFALDSIPECYIKFKLIQRVKDFLKGFPEAFAKALPEGFRKALPKDFREGSMNCSDIPFPEGSINFFVDPSLNQEQEQEQEQEQDLNKNIVEQARRSDALKIFEAWKVELSHEKAQFNEPRRKAVYARLKEGYTCEQILAAIRGIKNSPHHMGKNDRHTVYDDLSLICKDGRYIEKFADLDGKEMPNGEIKKNTGRGSFTERTAAIDDYITERKIAENRDFIERNRKEASDNTGDFLKIDENPNGELSKPIS